MHKLDVSLQRSKQFICLMIILLISSEAILITMSVSFWVKLLGAFILLCYGIPILLQHGFLSHEKSILRLSLNSDGWMVEDRKGSYPVDLLGTSTVTTKICILQFQMKEKKIKRSCLILRDSVSEDQYRKVLVHVRD